MRVIDFYNNVSYSHTSDRVIASPVAIGNIDSDPDYEIVITYKNKYNLSGQLIDLKGCFGVYKFNNGSFDTVVSEWILGVPAVESIQGPIIADCTGDGLPELVWLVNAIETDMTHCYYSLLDGTMWLNDGYPGKALSIELAKVVDHQPGLSYVTIKQTDQMKYLQSAYGGPQIFANYGLLQVDDSAFMVIAADILDLPPVVSSGQSHRQELIVISDSTITYVQPHYTDIFPIILTELTLYKTTVSSSLRSAAIANYNNGLALFAISHNGLLYSYTYPSRTRATNEVGQSGQSSRHTRCYEQPIPQEIYGSLDIEHPFVVDNPLIGYSAPIEPPVPFVESHLSVE